MTISVHVRCHCGSNDFGFSFNSASLPINNHLCHCTTCRHTTGQLAINQISVIDDLTVLTTTQASHLTKYRSSERAERYFCRKCGAHVLFHKYANNNWRVSSGLLEWTEGIAKVGYHIWVGDTVDGGMADYLVRRLADGFELPRHKEGIASPIISKEELRGVLPSSDHDEEKTNVLPGYCHCGTIRFSITRPSSDVSSLPSAPYPDLLFPYNTTPAQQIKNHNDEKWWICSGGEEKRYLAGYCACPSCRLTSGCDIQPWAFIPRANIISASGNVPIEVQDGGKRPVGLVQYVSSPGRHREFCGTCGATVFWWEDGRPDLLDVSVGLLGGKGARAEDWLQWHRGRVSFSETAISKDFVQNLEEGLKLV